MGTEEYARRVGELVKSGSASPAQVREMVAAVQLAFDHNLDSLTAINAGVGFEIGAAA